MKEEKRTDISVYLQGTKLEYTIYESIEKVIKMWEESGEILVLREWNGEVYEYISIRKSDCPVIEFRKWSKRL